MVSKSIGSLFVGGHNYPMGEIKLNQVLRQLNNKIIECKWDYNNRCWSFMRERTDKSFPNSYRTAIGGYFQIVQYGEAKLSPIKARYCTCNHEAYEIIIFIFVPQVFGKVLVNQSQKKCCWK